MSINGIATTGSTLSYSDCTSNEQIKEILEIHRKSVDWKKEAPTFNDYRANKIISLFQPKTTSTDIEEKELVSLNIKIATKDLVKRVDAIIPEMDLHSKISLRGKIIRLIAEELAPHLSNKSELKKEAVRELYNNVDFVKHLEGLFNSAFEDGENGEELREKELGFQYALAVCKYIKETYLSSNEKNSKSELKKEAVTGETSDGYHTFNELYEFRKLYNACLFNEWWEQGKYDVTKSKRHSDGEPCFGGDWFIVMATLPTGQISNHYEMKDWDLFDIPELEKADVWDGHTAQDVAKRLNEYLSSDEKNSKSGGKE